MNILLTGGAGDLGQVLTRNLVARGDAVWRLDIRPPQDDAGGTYVAASITDRALLPQLLAGMDMVVHIAAWHGIHEVRGWRDVYDFWDVNVTGTFEVFEAAVRAAVPHVLYISSTSVDEPDGVYGHTKVLGEEIARTYRARHGLNVLTLRPRAFIPHWNTATYANFAEWARWFWGGAVHIDDVAQATQLAIDLLASGPLPEYLTLPLDGAYEYTAADLANWDAAGPGSTFRQQYGTAAYDLALRHGLDPSQPPKRLDMSTTTRWLPAYQPRYSLQSLLDELAAHDK